MKKILELIFNNPISGLIFGMSIILGIIWAPYVIYNIFEFSLSSSISLLLYVLYAIFITVFWKKFFNFYCVLGICSSFIIFFYGGINHLPHKISQNVPFSSYHSRREYSSDYSSYNPKTNSSYRYSEPSDYIPHTKIPDDKDISYVPHIETETLIPSKTEEENENQSFSEPIDINTPEIDNSREEKKISSTSSEIYIHDNWEYVTSDEFGNKYYISKTFGVFNTTNNIEGTVFHALFRKVLSGNGIEVEVPAYDINRGMITEKKLLAYEESVICFRNENGFREIRFSTITGRTADNSVIVGWAIANIDNIYNWQLINNEIYNALYDSAYKKL